MPDIRQAFAGAWSPVRVQASRVAGLAALAALCVPANAPAQVFEIGADGTTEYKRSVGDILAIGEVGRSEGEPVGVFPEVPVAAVTEIAAADAPAAYRAALADAAERAKVSPALLSALVWQESRWRAGAVSPKGAMGLAQIMPGTARALAIDPRVASANLAGGARYLRQMLDRFEGDVERALAAYNAGPGRVSRAGGIPRIAETRAYVAAIVDRLAGTTGAEIEGDRR
jgi:soluble lytic murein transglycosylase-like protein